MRYHMLTVFAALLFVGGCVAGLNNNVLGVSLPICGVLVLLGNLLLSTLEGIESKLDDQVDATYDQTKRKNKQDP